ncbi:carboxyl transferase domain-containing protein [Streptomyces sp. M19]
MLGEGVAAQARFDPQAKALAEWLRSRTLDIPRSCCDRARVRARHHERRVRGPPCRHARQARRRRRRTRQGPRRRREKYVTRHRGRGKLLARERVELLLDPDTPFLELSRSPPGAATTRRRLPRHRHRRRRGRRVPDRRQRPDRTRRGQQPWTLKKSLRAHEIARANRLPVIALVESGGADLPSQKEIFIPGGAMFRDLTRLSADGIPTIAVVFGNSTAGGAYIPACPTT